MIGQPDRQLAEFGHLLIRRAILRDDWVADQIFDLAAEGQSEWTTQQWDTLLASLENSDQTVKEWLAIRRSEEFS